MTDPPSPHLTPLDLDLAAAGELSISERRRLDGHASRCPRCGEALHRRLGAEAQFTRSVLPRTLPRIMAAHRQRAWTARLSGSLLLVAATATSIVLLLASPRDDGASLPSRGSETALPNGDHMKGEALLHLFARRGERVFPVTAGVPLRAGDAIRFVIDPPGARYLLVASVDASGGVSIYFPYGGKASAVVDPRQRFEVPDSITLDSAPGPERVFAFFSQAPLSAEEVHKALVPLGKAGAEAIRNTREVGGLPATQTSFAFEKQP